MAELSSPAAVLRSKRQYHGCEMVDGVGAWSALGWILDAQRALARADRAVARAWPILIRSPSPLDLLYFGLTALFGSATGCRALTSRIARRRIVRS